MDENGLRLLTSARCCDNMFIIVIWSAAMEKQEFEQLYMTYMNPQQREAVETTDGAVLLLAVPGSGKTTVLVTRLGYMIYCCGIEPENILTMTYTVAATEEMKQRFAANFGEEYARRMEFRTINGVSSKIIAHYGRCYGRRPFALEENEGNLTALVKNLYRTMYEEFPDDSTVKDIRSKITYAKNMQLDREETAALEAGGRKLGEIFSKYNEALREMQLMDYDDQMSYALTILKKYPDILADFRARYRYICVDESQDTSKIQHSIIKLLSGDDGNLFMVGDEDQSIYGFRAAYPEALMNFEREHKNAKILLMEQNYRSTPEIVSAAGDFIAGNSSRREKNMTASKDNGSKVKITELSSREAQYTYLFEIAKNCSSETAVLYRNNDSAIPLIDMLERSGIAYNCRRFDETFFSHKIISDIRDIYAFSQDGRNSEAFMRIYYKLGCPIKKNSAVTSCERSAQTGWELLDEVSINKELSAFGAERVKTLKSNFAELKTDNARRAIDRIRYFMGYDEYVERNKLDDGKLTILSQLARSESSLGSLLERLEELKTIIAEHKNDRSVNFTLSTIHSSKGLEYDRVYIIDAIDGVLPAITESDAESKEEKQQYQEERRLFYVAMTRAKKELNLFLVGKNSGFVSEVKHGIFVREQETLAKMYEARKNARAQLTQQRAAIAEPKRAIRRPAPVKLILGERVVHNRFGMGLVTQLDENFVSISFDKEFGTKRFARNIIEQNGSLTKL